MSRCIITCLMALINFPCFGKSGALPGDSLYNIGSNWVNQNGETIQLTSLAGKNVVLSMVYLTCHFICPTVVSEIESMKKQLGDKASSKIQFILVSFDPARDNSKKMKDYAKKRKLDLKEWTFLTNKDENKIRELAAVLDFKYKKDKDGEFTHSFIIAVLDDQGVLTAVVRQANQDKGDLIKALSKSAP